MQERPRRGSGRIGRARVYLVAVACVVAVLGIVGASAPAEQPPSGAALGKGNQERFKIAVRILDSSLRRVQSSQEIRIKVILNRPANVAAAAGLTPGNTLLGEFCCKFIRTEVARFPIELNSNGVRTLSRMDEAKIEVGVAGEDRRGRIDEGRTVRVLD
jgi:hypothetical protein